MDDFKALVLLNMVEDLGSVRLKRCLEAFGTPPGIFGASVHQLCAAGRLSSGLAQRILQAPVRLDASKEINEADRKGIKIITLFDRKYPAILKEIYDPPYVLYVRGSFLESDINSLAIVGSRGASFYGLSCAQYFASQLAGFGLTIVSGLARGIDTAAHRACLNAGGRTVAVLGSGFDHLYPPENRGLAEQVARQGVVLTQFPLCRPPRPQNFPVRNRIVSGLVHGVLVVEASRKSGALITARCALEQGREVFAVPGNRTSLTSYGTNDLIKQGARMVTQPREILEELASRLTLSPLGISGELTDADAGDDGPMSSQAQRVMRAIDAQPKYIDQICQETTLVAGELMSVLMQLELKGLIKQLSGKRFVRSSIQ